MNPTTNNTNETSAVKNDATADKIKHVMDMYIHPMNEAG